MIKNLIALCVTLTICSGCAVTTAVQPTATGKSNFEGAVFTGETISLEKPTLGAESYRIFQQGSTGFVSIASVRSGVEEKAAEFCARKGSNFRGISETSAVPPYILGNFPRVELVFECAGRLASSTQPIESGKYEKLATVKKLLDSGAITQAEFESEKAKILSAP